LQSQQICSEFRVDYKALEHARSYQARTFRILQTIAFPENFAMRFGIQVILDMELFVKM